MTRDRGSTTSAPAETLREGGLDGQVVEDLVKHLFSPSLPQPFLSTRSLISSELVISLPFLPRPISSDSSSSIAGLSSICPSVTSAPAPVYTIALALAHVPSLAINTLPGAKWAVDVTVGGKSDEWSSGAASPSPSLTLSAQALAFFHLPILATKVLPGVEWSIRVKSVTRVEEDSQRPLEGETDEEEKWRANIEWTLKLNAGPFIRPLRRLIGSSMTAGANHHERPSWTLVTLPRTIDFVFARNHGDQRHKKESRSSSPGAKGKRRAKEVDDAHGEVEKVKSSSGDDDQEPQLRLVYVNYALPSTSTTRFPLSWIPRPIRSGFEWVVEALVALFLPFAYAVICFFGLDHGAERLYRLPRQVPEGRIGGQAHTEKEEKGALPSSTPSNIPSTRSASSDQDPAAVLTHPPLHRVLFASVLALVASALYLVAFAFDAFSSLIPETSQVGRSIRRSGAFFTELFVGVFAVLGDLVTLSDVQEGERGVSTPEGEEGAEPASKTRPQSEGLGRSELDHLQEWFDLELEEGAQATLGVDGERSGSGEMGGRIREQWTSSPGSLKSAMTAHEYEDVCSPPPPHHLGGKRVSFSSESAAIIGVAAGSPEPSRPTSPPALLTPPAAPELVAPPLSAPLVVVPSPPSVVAAPLVSSPTPISAPPSPGLYETDPTTYDLPRLATANNETSFLHFKVYHAAASRGEDKTESLARWYTTDEPHECECAAKPWPEGHDLAAKEAALLGGVRSGSIDELQAVQQVDELDALRRCRRMRASSVSLEDVEDLQKTKLAKSVAGHEAALLGEARSGGADEREAVDALESKRDEKVHERLEQLEREAYDSPVPRTDSPLDGPSPSSTRDRTHGVASKEAALLGRARSGSIEERTAVQRADELEELRRMEPVRLELTALEDVRDVEATKAHKFVAGHEAALLGGARSGTTPEQRAIESLEAEVEHKRLDLWKDSEQPQNEDEIELEAPARQTATRPRPVPSVSPPTAVARMQPSRAREFAGGTDTPGSGTLSPFSELAQTNPPGVGRPTTLAERLRALKKPPPSFPQKDEEKQRSPTHTPSPTSTVPEEEQEVEGKSLPYSPALEGKIRYASRIGEDVPLAPRPSIGTPQRLPIDELPTPRESQESASRESPESEPQSRYWTPPVATGEMVSAAAAPALDESSSIAPPPPARPGDHVNAADYPSPTSRFFTPPLASARVPAFEPASPSPSPSPTRSSPGSEGGKTVSTAPTSPSATVHEGGMGEKQQHAQREVEGVGGAGEGEGGGEGSSKKKKQKHKKKKKQKKSKGGAKAA
ncbi:hypothetical protein JCM1840_006056 [Sporobolomyces johnsonii]